LKKVINNSSIPKLEQINEQILSNPLQDPTSYTQLHHEQTLILQTLQKQQLRYFQTEQELNKLQLQYQQMNKSTVKFKNALPCIMEEERVDEMDQPDTESDDSFNTVSPTTTPTPANDDVVCVRIQKRKEQQHEQQKRFIANNVMSHSRARVKIKSNRRELKRILCKMASVSTSKHDYNRLADQVLYILNGSQLDTQTESILEFILICGIKQIEFGDEYAHLIKYLYLNANECVYKMYRNVLINTMSKLFYQYKTANIAQKRLFINVICFCGKLFRVGMLSKGVITKGIIEDLVPIKTAIHIEGMCNLFKQCGYALFDNDSEGMMKMYVDEMKRVCHTFSDMEEEERLLTMVRGVERMVRSGYNVAMPSVNY